MLEDSGYQFKSKDHFVSFKQSSSDRIGLVGVGILLFFCSFFLLTISTVVWVGAVLILILGLASMWKRMHGKSLLMFDLKDQTFLHKTRNGNPSWYPIASVAEIILKSKFMSEYTSAFKSTSEEHLITIGLKLDSGKTMEVFKFQSDYADPSIQIKEVLNWLESSVKDVRQVNKT